MPNTNGTNPERVVCAACKYPDGKIVVGVRHNWIVQRQRPHEHGTIQGFINQNNEFLTRVEARVVAEEQNQIVNESVNPMALFSEDIVREGIRSVICAANKFEDGHIIRGARHPDCYDAEGGKYAFFSGVRMGEEGFIDNEDKFLSRKEARLIATEAGQILYEQNGKAAQEELFSEHLY